MQFIPAEIPRSAFECREQEVSDQPLGYASICLYIDNISKNLLRSRESSPSNPGRPDLWSRPALDACLPSCTLSTPGVFVSLNAIPATTYSSVTLDLALDPGRLSPRATFQETKSRSLSRVRVLGLKTHCENFNLLLPVRLGTGVGGGRTGAGRGQGRREQAVFQPPCGSAQHGTDQHAGGAYCTLASEQANE
ncbi:hypothetical protein P7K49_023390 [Saguinus oedipus]|uniref:Uncharacterized protein n=1 Tax=Saguinus oedipus TaxID=9490 RepID=A0ABQ9ULK7_SAGOE|nr:hypothetical protein P7K49_023390 [Saguinus oedipus]